MSRNYQNEAVAIHKLYIFIFHYTVESTIIPIGLVRISSTNRNITISSSTPPSKRQKTMASDEATPMDASATTEGTTTTRIYPAAFFW